MTSSPSAGAARPSLPGWALPLVLGLFFMSGASGLVYEVVWTRVLLTVFGATIYAVATVLAAFMAGLALGSLLGGRLADRVAHPLRLYGGLELLAAVAAVSVPFALRLLDPVYRAIYATGETSFLELSLVRFALSFLVLLVPTTCMGATLPVLSRFVVRSRSALGGRIGGLYALNTAGAVTGTFVAGFVLVATLGVLGSLVAAAALSAAVGLTAVGASRRLEEVRAAGADPEGQPAGPGAMVSPRLARLVLLAYAASGFAALSLQVLWTRTLVFRFDILKNTTYSFSAMLTVFLVGLAAGSAVMSLAVNRVARPARLFGLLQLLTGVTSVLSLFVLLGPAGFLQVADPLTSGGGFAWGVEVANVFLRTAAVILLPTLLMGMAFPVAARLTVAHLEAVGAGVGRLYAVNTVGAIAGSFAAGFLLIPAVGLARGIVLLGGVYVATGAAVLVANPLERPAARALWSALAVGVLGALALASPGPAPFQDVSHGHTLVTDEEGRLAYAEGPLATVAVVENSIGFRTIYIDNASVAGTDRILLTDQKSLAHVPMLLLERPRSVLTVGFGSGGASWSYLLYPELERVDCVEICDTVLGLAHTLRASNHGLLDGWDRRSTLAGVPLHDGRYRVILDDARSYLRFSRQHYDVIATDCTDLRYKSNANLYDVEYFELCREAVTEDGMVVVWMPLGGMSPAVFACALRTFAHVFPDMTIWYTDNEPTHYLLLIGTRAPLRVNLTRLLERTARPEIRRDLAEVSLHQPEKLLSCFLTDAPAVAQSLAALNTVLNTEDTPYLEFESPKYGLGDEPLLANLELLRQHRRPVVGYVEDADQHPEVIERLGRFTAATDAILRGHAHLRRLELEAAARAYLEAQAICPEDDSLAFLLTFDDLRRREERNPLDPWSRLNLAEIGLLKGEVDEAGERFAQVYQLTADREGTTARSFFARSVLGLAECFGRVGDTSSALALLDRHAEQVKGQPDLPALLERLRGPAAQGRTGQGVPEIRSPTAGRSE